MAKAVAKPKKEVSMEESKLRHIPSGYVSNVCLSKQVWFGECNIALSIDEKGGT